MGGMLSLNQVDHVGLGGPDDGHWEYADTAGIQWARRIIRWYNVQPDSTDPYDWSFYDGLFSDLRNRTYPFEIMVILGAGTPEWAADAACADTFPNNTHQCAPADEHMDEFRDFVAAAADRYDYVDYWEVWNEAYKTDWNGGSPERPFFKGESPNELAEIVDTVDVAINSEDSIVCCGFIGANTTGDWTAEKMLDLTSNIDIVSSHCYSTGANCVSGENDLRDELESEGYSGVPQWMTEGFRLPIPGGDDTYHADSVNPIRPTDEDNVEWIKEYDALAKDSAWFGKYFMFRWAQTPAVWHEHPSNPDSIDWHIHGHNRFVIEQDTFRNFLGIREESYCALVIFSGNESLEGRCEPVSVTGISGGNMNDEVPPNSQCTFAATGETGGVTPYTYYWYVDGILEKSGSEDHITYSTPSAGSLEVEVTVEGSAGTQDSHSQTFDVKSGVMCPI